MPKPVSLLDAWSEIKQFSLVEKPGSPLDRDFFTPKMYLAFAEVGIRQSYIDSLLWVLGYVFFGTMLYFYELNVSHEGTSQILFWTVQGSFLYWCLKLASYSGMLFSTGVCMAISKHYTGNTPKQATNSLFTARAAFLLCMGIIIFILLGAIHKFALTPEHVSKICIAVGQMRPDWVDKLYVFLVYHLRQLLFEAAIIALISMTISVVLPYCSLIFFKFYRTKDRTLGLKT